MSKPAVNARKTTCRQRHRRPNRCFRAAALDRDPVGHNRAAASTHATRSAARQPVRRRPGDVRRPPRRSLGSAPPTSRGSHCRGDTDSPYSRGVGTARRGLTKGQHDGTHSRHSNGRSGRRALDRRNRDRRHRGHGTLHLPVASQLAARGSAWSNATGLDSTRSATVRDLGPAARYRLRLQYTDAVAAVVYSNTLTVSTMPLRWFSARRRRAAP